VSDNNGRRKKRPETISLLEVRRTPGGAHSEDVVLATNRGDITGILHPALADGTPGPAAVVWVGGAGGGLYGPAGGLYPDMADVLRRYGISSLRLHYRQPNDLEACVIDVLVGLAWLADEGVQRAALVGHSFGGAVVISAGALSPLVTGVVALSSQTYGTELVTELGPRYLLLAHGTADTVLPDRCSRQLYALAGEPKELVLYDGAGHGLDEVHRPLRDLLEDRLARVLTPGSPPVAEV
jgi:pimeloyl-ACP methyl ester carboxylesterase